MPEPGIDPEKDREKDEGSEEQGRDESNAENAEEKKKEAGNIIDSIYTLTKSIAPKIIDFAESIRNRKK